MNFDEIIACGEQCWANARENLLIANNYNLSLTSYGMNHMRKTFEQYAGTSLEDWELGWCNWCAYNTGMAHLTDAGIEGTTGQMNNVMRAVRGFQQAMDRVEKHFATL